VTPALKHVRRTSRGLAIERETEDERVRACRHGGGLPGVAPGGAA
jgi:hypothetical protein